MAKDSKGRSLPPGIRQRSKGGYEGRFMYEYKNYTVHGKTITEVKKKLADLRYELEHGTYVEKTKVTFDRWYSVWIEEYKKNQVKIGTIIAYNNAYAYYIKEAIGEMKLSNIRGEHIQKLYNSLNDKGIAVSYIKIVGAILNGCFKQALKNGLIERNPVPLATLPREREKKQRRVLTVEEQKLFFKYAETSYLFNMYALAIRTGLRGGEIRGLRFSDIDKKQSVIHIRRTLKYETGMGFFEDTPKTKTSMRDIPLTDDIVDILEQQKKIWNQKDVLSLDAYVFQLEDGKPISRERAQHELDRIVKLMHEKGIECERFTMHTFRHSFATRAIEAGMKPLTLKSLLGHSSLAQTMDLYSHVMPTTKAEEMKMIANVF